MSELYSGKTYETNILTFYAYKMKIAYKPRAFVYKVLANIQFQRKYMLDGMVLNYKTI